MKTNMSQKKNLKESFINTFNSLNEKIDRALDLLIHSFVMGSSWSSGEEMN